MNLMHYCGINLSKSERSSVVQGRRNGHKTSVFKKNCEKMFYQSENIICMLIVLVFACSCVCHI
jgi:hypothetical protein